MLSSKSDCTNDVNAEKKVPTTLFNSQNIECKDKEIPTASNSQREQEKDDLTVIDHMTLEDTLKLLEPGLLPKLDNDLNSVKEGKKTIGDHREYFKAQVDNKLKKLSLIYHPDSVQKQGGPEEERLKAE
ncbi:hypothetical protein, partial [Wolbachia pipientis]|uniref:hypothetical protein n=1 Tax=Wolbachia pipientis TaxID=955 RepID=UPI00202E0D76